jgi:branched-chain amino acid transport system permease protein
MTVQFIFLQLFNGLSWAMLLFLFTAGFTLIFGLMKIINLTHGSYYLFGAYFGIMFISFVKNLLFTAIIGGIGIAIIGMLMQRFLLHRYETSHQTQVLLTFGFTLFFADLALSIWGGEPKTIPVPHLLEGSIRLGMLTFPVYRLALILIGLLTAALLWWFLRSKYGMLVRAGIENEEMTAGVGVNISLLKTLTFASGAFLAGLAGVIGGPIIGVYPGLDMQILLLSLVIVIIGGMGSLKGAFIGSLLVGLIDTFIKALLPTFSLFAIFFIMAVTLMVRPSGLFGSE